MFVTKIFQGGLDMFETFARLHHWLAANNITKPITVTFTTDLMTADQIGCFLRDECNKLTMRLPSTELVKEGCIYGIPFKVEVK